MVFKCPKCGGSNNLELVEDEFLKCSYCNNYSYVDPEGIVSVYTFKSLIKEKEISLFLKKDFERIGFSEDFKITSTYPLYIPFWDVKGSKSLLRGSSLFSEETVIKPSEERIIFDYDSIAGKIDITEPDVAPELNDNTVLCYLPFYKVKINYKNDDFVFLINGMNGDVSGDPIPFVSVEEAGSLFPKFALAFFVAFVINFVFDNLFLSIFSNLVAIYLVFSFSISAINKNLYKNEH